MSFLATTIIFNVLSTANFQLRRPILTRIDFPIVNSYCEVGVKVVPEGGVLSFHIPTTHPSHQYHS